MTQLEQRCERPGLWLIEGRTVKRRRFTGHIDVMGDRVSVSITRWVIEYHGQYRTVETLREARELIADEVAPENYGR